MCGEFVGGTGVILFLLLVFGLWAIGNAVHESEEEKRKKEQAERLKKAEEKLRNNGIELPK